VKALCGGCCGFQCDVHIDSPVVWLDVVWHPLVGFDNRFDVGFDAALFFGRFIAGDWVVGSFLVELGVF
jgi:hypothetical protein